MTKRTFGTILMLIGFLTALGILMFMPDRREMSVIGFAIFGVGCMCGSGRGRRGTPPKKKK